MIQKRSCSLSAKVYWQFYDMIKVRLIMENNVKHLGTYTPARQKDFIQNKTKVPKKSRKFQIQLSGEITWINCAQAIWTWFLVGLIKVLR